MWVTVLGDLREVTPNRCHDEEHDAAHKNWCNPPMPNKCCDHALEPRRLLPSATLRTRDAFLNHCDSSPSVGDVVRCRVGRDRCQVMNDPGSNPTVVGDVTEIEQPEIQVEAVRIGVLATETVMTHALPGMDQPRAGNVPACTSIEPTGAAFENEDRLIRWWVRAGTITGEIQPNIAYRVPTQNITDQVLPTFRDQGPFGSPEDAAVAVTTRLWLTKALPRSSSSARPRSRTPRAPR